MACQPLTFETVVEKEFEHIGLGVRYEQVPGMDPARAPKALCLSGGGIRSATFALGVLQALAKRKLLSEFHYLSTVSGGGYIGAWLSAWLRRTSRDTVLQELQNPEAEPVRHLRQYSNYLSPRLGMLSADTWTLVAIFIRNLLLNWVILLPTLAAAILVPYLCVQFLCGDPASVIVQRWTWVGLALGFVFGLTAIFQLPRWLPCVTAQTKLKSESRFVLWHLAPLLVASVALTSSYFYMCQTGWDLHWLWFVTGGAMLHGLGWVFGAKSVGRTLPWLAWGLILAIGALAGAGYWALASQVLGPWAIQHRPYVYVVCALPLALAGLCLANFLCVAVGSRERRRWFQDEDREWLARAAGWLLIVAVVWLAFSGLALFGPRALRAIDRAVGEAVTKWYLSVGGTLSGALSAVIGWSSKTSWLSKKGDGKLAGILGGLAEKLLAPLFAVWLLATLARGVARLAEGRPWSHLVAASAILFGLGWLLGYFLSVNRFALHNMYRNRLIRAYLGASRGGERQPDPLTGFDPKDNLLMTELCTTRQPFHLLNLTLNITTGEELAWQQRKAQSFTVSSLYAGYGGPGDDPAYQGSRDYTDQGGISLGTAMTVSGAAASPNMGYHSSHVLAFLMTLFNARLGAWLPNSRSDKPKVVQAGGPRSPFFLWREAFGMASAKAPWVYLSDGGHFDNLGLYEMVRRHAKLIVASDAGADPDYALGDLSRAIQNIRADMGVPIEFVKTPVLRPKSQGPSHHCALLKIRYSAAHDEEPDGLLLYIKPAISGQEVRRSRDVHSYSAAHKDFPQESTGDQFFSEAQFESYRRLGEQSVEEITDGWKGSALAELFDHVEKKYLATLPQAPTANP